MDGRNLAIDGSSRDRAVATRCPACNDALPDPTFVVTRPDILNASATPCASGTALSRRGVFGIAAVLFERRGYSPSDRAFSAPVAK
jgi:hypothetical protein